MSAGRCRRVGCEKPARWLPVLLLFAPLKYGPHDPTRCVLALGHCHDCKLAIFPEDLISDAGWAQITRIFRGLGRAEPDRARVLLEWVPAGDDPLSRGDMLVVPQSDVTALRAKKGQA